MKIVFMGTPDFARDSLEAIYNAGHDILAVVTNVDKPKGRGMKMIATPVKEFAIEKNLPVFMHHFFLNIEVQHQFNGQYLMEIKKQVLLQCIWILVWIQVT